MVDLKWEGLLWIVCVGLMGSRRLSKWKEVRGVHVREMPAKKDSAAIAGSEDDRGTMSQGTQRSPEAGKGRKRILPGACGRDPTLGRFGFIPARFTSDL